MVDKSHCFGLFYRQILQRVHEYYNCAAPVPDIYSLIVRIAGAIHRFDDYTDIYRLSAAEARKKTFTWNEKTGIVRSIVETMNIAFDEERLDENLDIIEDYFEAESRCAERPARDEDIRHMLHFGNCDFRFYNSILYAHIEKRFGGRGKRLAGKMENFLTHYLQLDLLLDHYTDVDEDLSEKSFNVLLWTLRSEGCDPEAGDVQRQLWNRDIYGRFRQLALDYSACARAALSSLRHYPSIYRLFRQYLINETLGLNNFYQNRGYAGLSPDLRNRFTTADLKPQPWTTVPPLDIRKEVRVINRKLRRESRVIIALGGRCEHSGCLHCALSQGVADTTFEQFQQDLHAVDFSAVDTICLYTPGSFFKPGLDSRREKILKAVADVPFKRLMIESRPELITNAHLDELANLLRNIEIEIGIGLDHVNDTYRNRHLNKGISVKDYEASINLIKTYPVKSMTYVAIGCPYLTERQALDSAIETARYAMGCGTDILSFEPLIIQENTTLERLQYLGKLKRPEQKDVKKILELISKEAEKVAIEVRYGGLVQVPRL